MIKLMTSSGSFAYSSEFDRGKTAEPKWLILVTARFTRHNNLAAPSQITPRHQSCAMTETVQRIVLASRPVGEPTLDNFRLEELPIPQPGPGQMLLRTLWLSLDPYMRGRMSDAPSYAKPVGIGDVMEGGTVSEVVASNVPRFAKSDVVVGRNLPLGMSHQTRGDKP
jgi:N-terminal domain of oxidoreductase